MKKRPKPKRSRSYKRQSSARADWIEVEQSAREDIEKGEVLTGLKKLDSIITDGHPTLSTWLLIGQGLMLVKEFAQALDAFEHANKQDSTSTDARFGKASALYELGDVSSAVNEYRQVLDYQDSLNAWCNLATIIPGCPKSTNQDVLLARIEFAKRLEAEAKNAGIGERNQANEGASQESNSKSDGPSKSRGDRLRIGYVSAYFHRENYMKPVWGLIEAHDREKVEIVLFADHSKREQLEWFGEHPGDEVCITTDLDNGSLVELIQSKQLDVVVDLNAYSVPTRLAIYTQRLAKRVVAWFNMYATSGIPKIDAIIGDPWVIPKLEDEFYTERVIRLPVSYLTFDVAYDAPPVTVPPCLASQTFTFGSLISQYKITQAVFDRWAAILKGAPSSKLLLANRALKSACNRDYVTGQFAARGIESSRIELRPPADHRAFLRYYDEIDIALDAFPYNGGTTTTEALWQGVPVLAIDGDRWAARTSKTLIVNSGLESFVCESEDDYVAQAIEWANRSEKWSELAERRSAMRDHLQQAPVCDRHALASQIERHLAELIEQ